VVTALIVGAGAVGQVYGHFLQRGGASVSYFVKEKYKHECEKGFTLYRCRRSGLGAAEQFFADGIFTQYDDLTKTKWDQVWLTVSSADLRGGWLEQLREVIGDATVVMLQPDLDDRDYVYSVFPQEQVVCGIVNFISYQTPLPDLPDYHADADKEGVAYLLLPMMSAEFSGNEHRLPEVMEAMASGRFNVKVEQDASRIYADRSAMMIPLVALLELENWSFKKLRLSNSLDLAVGAAREALVIVAAKFGRRMNWTERLFSLFWVKMALPVMRFLSPMDAESYVKFQFVKTAPQTRMMLKHFIDDGEKLGQSTQSLKALYERLPEQPAVKQAA
jgi:ketopantoate reductase